MSLLDEQSPLLFKLFQLDFVLELLDFLLLFLEQLLVSPAQIHSSPLAFFRFAHVLLHKVLILDFYGFTRSQILPLVLFHDVQVAIHMQKWA